jgi:hypothetical protein
MSAVLVLNVVLVIAVVGMVVGLLSWAIISSRADRPPVATAVRQPAPRPSGAPSHAPHPHWPNGHWPQQRSREPVAD